MEELQQQLEFEKQRNVGMDATLQQSAEAGQFLLSQNQALQEELEGARLDLESLKSSVEKEKMIRRQSMLPHMSSSKVDDQLEERLEEVMEEDKALTEECRRLEKIAHELRVQKQAPVAQVDDPARSNKASGDRSEHAGSPGHDDHGGAHTEESLGIHKQVKSGLHLTGAMRDILQDVKEQREKEYACLKADNKVLKSRVEQLETQYKEGSERMDEISEELEIAESKVEELEDSQNILKELLEKEEHKCEELRGHIDLLQQDIQDKSEKISSHNQSKRMTKVNRESRLEHTLLSSQMDLEESDEEEDSDKEELHLELEARLQQSEQHWAESEEFCGRYEHELARFELSCSHAETLADVHAEELARLRDEHSSMTLQLQSSEMELCEHQREKMLSEEAPSFWNRMTGSLACGVRTANKPVQSATLLPRNGTGEPFSGPEPRIASLAVTNNSENGFPKNPAV